MKFIVGILVFQGSAVRNEKLKRRRAETEGRVGPRRIPKVA